MKMNDKVYDILKWIAQYLLPAIGTLYFALAGIWGLPYGEQIVGSITAIDTFLGVILGLSSIKYNKTDNSSKNIQFLNSKNSRSEISEKQNKRR